MKKQICIRVSIDGTVAKEVNCEVDVPEGHELFVNATPQRISWYTAPKHDISWTAIPD